MEKSKYRATYEGSVGREWVAIFNGLIRLGLIEKCQASEKRLEAGQGISHMWGACSIQREQLMQRP